MEWNGKGSRAARRAIFAGALALVLVGLVALSAQARGRGWGGREPSPDRQAARIAERLGLSTEQQTQVRKIFTDSLAKRREIREEGRKKMDGLREETETRLSGVLTPEQMTALRNLKEERRERRGDCRPLSQGPEGPGEGVPGGPPPQGD